MKLFWKGMKLFYKQVWDVLLILGLASLAAFSVVGPILLCVIFKNFIWFALEIVTLPVGFGILYAVKES